MDAKRGVNFIGVTVPFVVHDGKGKVLLQKRSQNCRDERGRWDTGGGAVEFNESLEDAVRREVKEELGADAKKIQFLTMYEALRDNNGTPTHWICLSHTVEVDSKKVKIADTDKIDEIGWFTSKKWPVPLHSQIHKSLDAAKKAGVIK